MAKSPDNTFVLYDALKQYGFVCFGGLAISADECAFGSEGLIGKRGLLIGNAGQDMWHVFSKSPEYADGEKDPMNRWTKRVLDEIASLLGASVVYPFDEPYWPFQRLAQKAANAQPSPLGILIHSEFGLWHAFRGLIIFDEVQGYESQINALGFQAESLNHPCDNCFEKPCLSICPVGAFTGKRLDVQSCFSHLDSPAEPHCMMSGCEARRGCPVAKEHQYNSAQMKFHMQSYRGS